MKLFDHKFFHTKTPRIIMLVIYDILAIFAAEYLAIITRFDFSLLKVEQRFLTPLYKYTLINIAVTIGLFVAFRLYNSLWKYAGVMEMFSIVGACLFSTALQLMGITLFKMYMPRGYYILYFFFLIVLIMGCRFLYRSMRTVRDNLVEARNATLINTMILGAGDTAYSLLHDMQDSRTIRNKPVCIIDANPQKRGSRILGVPIVGDDTKIRYAVEKYKVQEIFIAITHIPAKRRKELIELCKGTGCRVRMLPSTSEIVIDKVKVTALRVVRIVVRLGREPVKTNAEEIAGYVKDKVVLVTGGGGSIGSELCRQIAAKQPKMLVIFDIYENTTYDLQLELGHVFPELNLKVLIGSVRDSHKVKALFDEYKPDIVFHAAAHKHVPLMEDSPNEAIKNNVFGTLNVAKEAAEHGTSRMVLISTDKAVNPTNIMGASKRVCEMVVQGMAKKYPDTNFVAVRFGNVLGSNGSVVPLFKKQIAEGGPVTVTDKNIIRYFMTIPEAVSLVLQAGAYAKGGEIFILDMGEPVKIDDMARNLIRLSGFEPDVDIPIVYTGLRPGEKLYEECLKAEEGMEKTDNNLIFIAHPVYFDVDDFFDKLVTLKSEAYGNDPKIKELIKEFVPTYTIDERENDGR